MTESKQFLMTFWDGGGVVPPMLGIARRLIARGHRVHVLSDPTCEAEALAAGCSFGPWQTAPHRTTRDRSGDLLRDYEHSNPAKYFRIAMREFFGEPGPRWVADLLAELERHPADVVIGDALLPWPVVAAQKLGRPCALLSPNVLMLPWAGLTPAGLGLRPARGPLGRLRDAFLRRMMTRVMNGALPPLNAVRAELGLPPLSAFVDQHRQADRILVLTSAAFDFCSNARLKGVHWVGPQLDDPSWSEPWRSPWPADDPRPLVLVGLGSTFQKQIATTRNVVRALAQLPVRGLVTLGPAISPDEVPTEGDVAVVSSVPHAAVLPDVSVLVTHGGHGTTIKGAAAGVPMLCIPLGRDQSDNAVRIREHGAGITLRPTASVHAIRTAIKKLLDEPGYRERARALAEAMRRGDGEDDPIAILESLANASRPSAAAPVAAAS